MPRVLTRPVLREIVKPSLVPLEILDVSIEPPYTEFQHHFVNDVRPLTFGSVTYQPLGWSRGPYEVEAGSGVDRVTITLDDVEKYWASVVQSQSIQGSRLRLRKVFLGLLTDEANKIDIFDGFAGTPQFDDTTFAVEIRSIVDYHETELPTRTFQSSCPYFLGEARCGVDMTSIQNRIEVIGVGGSSKRKIKSPLLAGYGASHWIAGYVLVVNGPDKGLARPIENSTPGEATLFVPFNFSLEGQHVRVVRGCRKTKADCQIRHNNLPNYGGFAEVPKSPIIDV